MSRFSYEAVDAAGESRRGELEAANRDEALKQLAELGLSDATLAEPAAAGRPMSRNDADQLTDIIAEVTEAGLPLALGLRAAAAEVRPGRLRSVLLALAQYVESGVSLNAAIRELQPVVPDYLAGLLVAGVRTNNVSRVLTDIADFRIRMRELWVSLWASLAYPTSALLIGAVLFALFSIYIVTPFRDMFESFAMSLPLPTRVMMWWNQYGGWMLLSVVVAAPLVAVFTPLIFGMPRSVRIMASIPVVGSLFHWCGMAEMLRLLSLMIENSIPLPEALRLTANGVRDASIRKSCEDLARDAESGRALWHLAVESDELPPSIVPLLRWGEDSGRLAEALRVSADMLENRVRTRSKMLRVAYPPLVFLLIFVAMAFAIVSLYLPLSSLMSGLMF